MYKIVKFIYFVLIRYLCNAEWIEVTRIIDESHHKPSNIFTKSNFMHEIQPLVNINPIVKNSYILDEFLNTNLSNEKPKVHSINNHPDTTSIPTTTTLNPNKEDDDGVTISELDEKCDNCAFSTEQPPSNPISSNITNDKNSNTFNFMETPNNLENIFNFMNQIQKSFNATTSRHSKINVLQTLKTDLIANIEQRLETLFPAKIKSETKRRKRGIITSEGHMDFPSAEGALITICFLTFAVFLIKLVLQVINTIKSKHYNYNGLDQGTMSAVKMMKTHKLGRSISDENYNTEKILSSIYNYKSFK